MKPPTLYISGPMSGYQDFNFLEFNRVAAALRFLNYPVLNPAENFGGVVHPDMTRKHYMRLDIQYVLACDGIAVLDGWEGSKGAMLEVEIAKQLDLPVRHWQDWWNGVRGWHGIAAPSDAERFIGE